MAKQWNNFPNISEGSLITANDIKEWLAAVKTTADQVSRSYCSTNNGSVCDIYNSTDNGTDKGVWTTNKTVKGK